MPENLLADPADSATRFPPQFRRAVSFGAIAVLVCLAMGAMVYHWVKIDGVITSEFSPRGPWLAELFLHGKVGAPLNGPIPHEYLAYNEMAYDWKPPLPFILQMPVVALFGASLPVALFFHLLVNVSNALLLWRLLRVAGVSGPDKIWLLGAFALGTPYLEQSGYGSHSVCIAMLLCALNLLFVDRPFALIIGLFIGLAFLSRQMAISMSLFLWVALLIKSDQSIRSFVKQTLLFSLGIVPAIAVYLSYNYLRFGSPFDAGYRYLHWIPSDPVVSRHGLFSVFYIPFNATYMFFQGLHIQFAGRATLPAQPDAYGFSLIAGSPFLLIAFAARLERRVLLAAWIAIIICATATLMYFGNGFTQFTGQRYMLDFLPLLFILVAVGFRQLSLGARNAVKLLIVYAVVINVFALAAKGGLLNVLFKIVS